MTIELHKESKPNDIAPIIKKGIESLVDRAKGEHISQGFYYLQPQAILAKLHLKVIKMLSQTNYLTLSAIAQYLPIKAKKGDSGSSHIVTLLTIENKLRNLEMEELVPYILKKSFEHQFPNCPIKTNDSNIQRSRSRTDRNESKQSLVSKIKIAANIQLTFAQKNKVMDELKVTGASTLKHESKPTI